MNDIAQEKILERLNTPVPALDESKRVVIRVDRVYGNLTYYPECDNGRIFAAISGKKTLTHDTLRGMSALGYWFQFKTMAGV